MLIVQADEVDVLGGGQLGDGGGGGAGHDESGVDLAVGQGLGAVAEGLIGGLDVILGQTVGAENVDGVEVHAGAGGADGDGLALQIRNGLDLGIQGDDLDLLHVQGSDDGEAVDRAELLKGAGAGEGIGQNVGLGEAQLRIAHIQRVDVRGGTAGGDRGDVGAGDLADLLGQNAAEAVIGAGLAAGGEGQLGAAVLRGHSVIGKGGNAQSQNHAQSQCKSQNLFHVHFLLVYPCIQLFANWYAPYYTRKLTALQE